MNQWRRNMTEVMNERYCTNCGETIHEQAEICTGCGVRQGTLIHYCYNCGKPIQEHQELCLNCGVNPRKIKKQAIHGSSTSSQAKGQVNVTLATIVGYLLPGLPSLLWYGQKTKGIVFIGVSILCLLLFPVVGNIILGVGGAIDAYQLGKRVNQGEALGPWTFFWDK